MLKPTKEEVVVISQIIREQITPIRNDLVKLRKELENFCEVGRFPSGLLRKILDNNTDSPNLEILQRNMEQFSKHLKLLQKYALQLKQLFARFSDDEIQSSEELRILYNSYTGLVNVIEPVLPQSEDSNSNSNTDILIEQWLRKLAPLEKTDAIISGAVNQLRQKKNSIHSKYPLNFNSSRTSLPHFQYDFEKFKVVVDMLVQIKGSQAFELWYQNNEEIDFEGWFSLISSPESQFFLAESPKALKQAKKWYAALLNDYAEKLFSLDKSFYLKCSEHDLLTMNTKSEGYNNLHRFVERISQIVRANILAESSIDERTFIIESWIHIAEILIEKYQDYNASMAIISVFQYADIYRLDASFRGLSSAAKFKLEKMQTLFSEQGNYSTYREALRDGPTSVLLNMGVFCKDKTFLKHLHEENTFLYQLSRHQLNIQADLIDLGVAQTWLAAFPRHDGNVDKTSYDTSLQVEPRNPEKPIKPSALLKSLPAAIFVMDVASEFNPGQEIVADAMEKYYENLAETTLREVKQKQYELNNLDLIDLGILNQILLNYIEKINYLLNHISEKGSYLAEELRQTQGMLKKHEEMVEQAIDSSLEQVKTTLLDLSEVKESPFESYHHIGKKTGGARSDGEFGGWYADAEGNQGLIKRDDHVQAVIAEQLAGELINAVTLSAAKVDFIQIKSSETHGPDETGEATYIMSHGVKGFQGDLWQAVYQFENEQRTNSGQKLVAVPSSRPRNLGSNLERQAMLRKYLQHLEIQNPDIKREFAEIMAASLWAADFDVHWGNLVVSLDEKKVPHLVRIDFGCALKDILKTPEIHPHSHTKHPVGLGPTNHFREYPRHWRISEEMGHYIHQLADYNSDEFVDGWVDKLSNTYGYNPLVEFCRYIGLSDIPDEKTDLLSSLKSNLKQSLKKRKASLLNFAREIELSLCVITDAGTIDDKRVQQFVKMNTSYVKDVLEGNRRLHLRSKNRKEKLHTGLMKAALQKAYLKLLGGDIEVIEASHNDQRVNSEIFDPAAILDIQLPDMTELSITIDKYRKNVLKNMQHVEKIIAEKPYFWLSLTDNQAALIKSNDLSKSLLKANKNIQHLENKLQEAKQALQENRNQLELYSTFNTFNNAENSNPFAQRFQNLLTQSKEVSVNITVQAQYLRHAKKALQKNTQWLHVQHLQKNQLSAVSEQIDSARSALSHVKSCRTEAEFRQALVDLKNLKVNIELLQSNYSFSKDDLNTNNARNLFEKKEAVIDSIMTDSNFLLVNIEQLRTQIQKKSQEFTMSRQSNIHNSTDINWLEQRTNVAHNTVRNFFMPSSTLSSLRVKPQEIIKAADEPKVSNEAINFIARNTPFNLISKDQGHVLDYRVSRTGNMVFNSPKNARYKDEKATVETMLRNHAEPSVKKYYVDGHDAKLIKKACVWLLALGHTPLVKDSNGGSKPYKPSFKTKLEIAKKKTKLALENKKLTNSELPSMMLRACA